MIAYGWTEFNSIAAFFPEGFEPTGQEKYLFAWVVESENEVQSWLVEDSGWDGTIYDAASIDTARFVEKAESLFHLPRKAILPDLSWITKGWIVYEGSDEVSMVGEGAGRWLIVYYSLGSYAAEL